MSLSIIWIILFFHHGISESFQCKILNDHGQINLDWYLIYKRPKDWEYFLFTNDKLPQARNEDTLQDESSPYYQTISSIWNDQVKDYFFIAYNDEPAYYEDCDASTDAGLYQKCQNTHNPAHSKGVLAIDFTDPKKLSAFWMIHSIPAFPSVIPNQTKQPVFDVCIYLFISLPSLFS